MSMIVHCSSNNEIRLRKTIGQKYLCHCRGTKKIVINHRTVSGPTVCNDLTTNKGSQLSNKVLRTYTKHSSHMLSVYAKS